MKMFNFSIVQLLLVLITLSIGLPSVAAEELDENYPFGKIFTIKNQRISLDRMRLQKTKQGSESQISKILVEEEQLSNTREVSFSGYMTQKDGSQVFWVNGKTELGNRAKDISIGKTSDADNFVFQVSSDRAKLKPGQVWLLDEDKVIEKYEVKKVVVLPKDLEQPLEASSEEKTEI
ncbi:MAG: hypothetical protein ACI9FB_000736 [Candidatus Azotimanducaceae bacterium]|jgi:hypothetical protein